MLLYNVIATCLQTILTLVSALIEKQLNLHQVLVDERLHVLQDVQPHLRTEEKKSISF